MLDRDIEPPEDTPVTYCAYCGNEIYEGEPLFMIDGGICEKRLNDDFRKLVSLEDRHEF